MRQGILLCFFLMLYVILRAEDSNLIKNGNFELLSPQTGKIANWQQWPAHLEPGASIEQDSALAYKGSKSLRIQHRNASSYSRIQQLNVRIKPNTKYIISCYMKGSGVNVSNGGIGIKLFVGRNGNFNRTFFTVGPAKDKKNFNWTKFSYGPFDSEKETSLGITLYLHRTSGTVWFDKLELLEITDDMEKQRRISLNRNILENDLCSLTEIVNKSKKTKYLEQLQKYKEKIQTGELTDKAYDPRNGIPFCPEQEKIFKTAASLLKDIYPEKMVLVDQTDTFSRHNYLSLPSKLTSKVNSTEILDNTGQFTLNFTNITGKSIKLNIALSGELSRLNTKVRKIIYVEEGNGKCIDDALPRLYPDKKSGKYEISLYPGLSQQIWFEYHTPGAPGTCKGEIEISYTGKVKKIPVKVNILNIRFPSKLPVSTYCYAYLPLWNITKDRMVQCASDLKKHHMNSIFLHQWQEGLPEPVFNSDGNFVPEKMDWTKLDRTLKIRGIQDKYIFEMQRIFLDMNKFEPGSPKWEKLINDWVRAIVNGLKKRDINYDKIIVTLQDEPHGEYLRKAIERYALIKRIDPKLILYSNFFTAATPAEISKLLPHVNIIAPEKHCLSTKYLSIIKPSRKKLWMYTVQSRNEKPDDIKKLFWKMSEKNIKGFSFWAYGDAGGTPWTPHDSHRHDYTVIYDGDKNEITPSKRWEALREGIEDYTLLNLLKKQNFKKYNELISQYKQGRHIKLLKKKLFKYLNKSRAIP